MPPKPPAGERATASTTPPATCSNLPMLAPTDGSLAALTAGNPDRWSVLRRRDERVRRRSAAGAEDPRRRCACRSARRRCAAPTPTLWTNPGKSQGGDKLVPDYTVVLRGDAAQPEPGAVMMDMTPLATHGSPNEEGTALIIALMSMMLLTALAAAVVMVSNTETQDLGQLPQQPGSALRRRRRGRARRAGSAARAALERHPRRHACSRRFDRRRMRPRRRRCLAAGMMTLCCGTNTATGQLQALTDTPNLWGANNPQWKLFAWGPLSDMLPERRDRQPDVRRALDGRRSRRGPTAIRRRSADVERHADAPCRGASAPPARARSIEVTVARTSGTEIERGQIAQRGQEELNQRARKAAVQTPGQDR